jgi:hypothetical protein
MTTEASNPPAERVHPLKKRDQAWPKDIRNWDEWVSRWEAADGFQELHGLLHAGFDLSIDFDSAADRVAFYLSIADGHNSSFGFYRDPYGASRDVNLRHELSIKAFKVLTRRFFSNTNTDRYYAPSWFGLANHSSVLPELLWFFRAVGSEHYSDNIPNLSLAGRQTTKNGIAKNFLCDLAEIAWGTTDVWRSIRDFEASPLYACRPELFRIMLALGDKPTLNRIVLGRDQVLDDESLAHLTELAMNVRTGDHYGPLRPAVSLDEAVAKDNNAAMLLLRYEAKQRGLAVIRERDKAERAIEEANRALRRLGATPS